MGGHWPWWVSCLNYRLELPSQSTRVQNALFCCNLKNNRINLVHFQGKSLNSTVIQVYAPTSNAEVEQFYEDLQGLVELTPKQTNKNCHFHHRGLECKRRKSRDTWSNGQVWPWSTQWSRSKACFWVLLTEFCQEDALVIAKTLFQQHKNRLYTWTSLDGHY